MKYLLLLILLALSACYPSPQYYPVYYPEEQPAYTYPRRTSEFILTPRGGIICTTRYSMYGNARTVCTP